MSNIDERFIPKTLDSRKMYSLVKDGEVVVGSVDKVIAEKWLESQQENGDYDATIIEVFDFENEIKDEEEIDEELIDEILSEIYEEEDAEGFHEFESGKFIYDEFDANP